MYMFALFFFFLSVLASPFKSKSRLEAENAVLRHQLIVLRLKVPGRVRLTNNDRWFLIQPYRWFPSILQVVTVSLRRSCGGIGPAFAALGADTRCHGAQCADAQIATQPPNAYLLFPQLAESFPTVLGTFRFGRRASCPEPSHGARPASSSGLSHAIELANTPSNRNVAFPAGVAVSRCCWCRYRSTPLAFNSPMKFSAASTRDLRAKAYSRQAIAWTGRARRQCNA